MALPPMATAAATPAPAPLARGDPLVYLPHASHGVQTVCVLLYSVMGAVALVRALAVPPHGRRRAHELKHKQTFQRLLVAFAVARVVSLDVSGVVRNLAHRLALCLFFSLVLFQVLFWIDIANAKTSVRSRRIWRAFAVSNAVFYAFVVGISLAHVLTAATNTGMTLERDTSAVWDVVPVVLIALGSLFSAFGLLYSTQKTRRRVRRVLRQAADPLLPKTLADSVAAKLARGMRMANTLMRVCAIVFVIRATIYLQRPFSHRECGAIRDADACVIVGYAIPELVVAVLFQVLMWEVEPRWDGLVAHRRASLPVLAMAHAAETLPLLEQDRALEMSPQDSGQWHVPRLPSPFRGDNVFTRARQRIQRVIDEHFWTRTEDQGVHARTPSRRSRSKAAATVPARVWMSFECSDLAIPPAIPANAPLVLVIHRVEASDIEIARSEVVDWKSGRICFRCMLAISEITSSTVLRTSIFAVVNTKAVDALRAQWPIGSARISALSIGCMDACELQSASATLNSVGTMIARCEAPLCAESTDRIARAFVFCADSERGQRRVMVEEELVESVHTWDVPIQLLQLMLSDLEQNLELLQQDEEGMRGRSQHPQRTHSLPHGVDRFASYCGETALSPLAQSSSFIEATPNASSPSLEAALTPISTRSHSAPSVGMLSEMILQIQDDAIERKNRQWRSNLILRMQNYVLEVKHAIRTYDRAHYDGHSFKPSTLKADEVLRFVALNLHQQLFLVGNLATSDETADDRSDDASPLAAFARYQLHATTTVGAFAAHVYGFERGGVRQLRGELRRLEQRLTREAERPGTSITVEALEREWLEVHWQIHRRLEVALCQALSALATCFQQTLYAHLQEDQRIDPGMSRVHGLAYLEMLTRLGFLFSVESLLSTYRQEAGMLGDMDAAVRALERVVIRLRPIESPHVPDVRVAVTRGSHGLVLELPLLLRWRTQELPPDTSMHRVLGQDACSGAVILRVATSKEFTRARRILRRPINVVPVLFSQGMNELQTVANTVGKDVLQKDINMENLVVLDTYVRSFLAWQPPRAQRRDHHEVVAHIEALLPELQEAVQRATGKCMRILTLSSSIARAMGGGRVTCCKSAKDRTAMSITLEEATLLVEAHGIARSERDNVTRLLRTHGVRLDNARKNTGSAQYCFSALQNYLLPSDYQCPPGTGGGNSSLS